MCVYGACLFFMSVVVTVCGYVCCVAAFVKDSVLALKCLRMLFVCGEDEMDVVLSVCIVRRGAEGVRV